MVAMNLHTKRELAQPMPTPLAAAREVYRVKLRAWLTARQRIKDDAEAERKAKAEMIAAETAYIERFRLLPEVRKLIDIAPELVPKS